MTLLLLAAGKVYFGQRRPVLAGADGSFTSGSSRIPFSASAFVKALAVTLTLVLVGFAATILVAGSISATNIGGSLISAVVLAYLAHLWMTPRNG